MNTDMARKAATSPFPSTRWSTIVSAGEIDHPQHRESLGRFLQRYTDALVGHLVKHRRMREETARDWVQDFLTNRVLERHLLKRAHQGKGQFRVFLGRCLDNHVRNGMRDARVRELACIPIDGAHDTVKDRCRETSWRQQFDQQWAREVLAQAAEQMKQACEADGRQDLWLIFDQRLLHPILQDEPPLEWAELAVLIHMPDATAEQLSNLLTTAKRRFAKVLHEVVAVYANDPQEVEQEIKHLWQCLARS